MCLFVGAIVVLSRKTHEQAGCWRTGRTLWESAIRSEPNHGIAHVNLGQWYLEQGNTTYAIKKFKKGAKVIDGVGGVGGGVGGWVNGCL